VNIIDKAIEDKLIKASLQHIDFDALAKQLAPTIEAALTKQAISYARGWDYFENDNIREMLDEVGEKAFATLLKTKHKPKKKAKR